jgi:hypothetical protein
MKLHFLFIYLCVIVAGVLLIIEAHREPLKLVAVHDVPVNHLLQQGDLVLQTTGKQYVTKHLLPGSVVDPRDIATAPELTAKKGFTPFALAVEPQQVVSRAIDAGQTLFVCPAKVQVEVRAVFCSGDNVSCIAVLYVPDADVEKVKAAIGSKPALQKTCG